MAKRIVDEEMRFTVVINGNEGQKQLYDLEKRNRKLTAANKDLREERAKLAAQGKKNTQEYKNLSAEITKNNAEIKKNKSQMSLLQKQIGVTGLTMRQLQSRANELKIMLRNMVPGSAEYKRYQKDLQEVNNQMLKLRGNARASESGLSKLANGFNKYAALATGVIAAGTGVVLSIQKMIDYNGKLSDSQSNVQKTTGLNAKEVDKLTKSFGLFKTRTARIELLKLAEDAGRLGIKGTKNIRDFVEVANQLKVALGDDLGEKQIQSVGKMVTVYKVGEKTGRDFKNSLLSLGSAINEVSASGANQAGFLVDYLERQAGIAAQARVSAEDNLAYAATFDELGQSVEVSATAMNKVWVDMFKNTADYAKIAGMNLKDFTDLLNKDANAAMIAFLKGLNGNNEGLTVMLNKMEDLEAGGTRGVAALSALAKNTELLETRQKQSNKALQEATSLTNEYALKNNNLAALLDRIKKNLIGAFSSPAIVNGATSLLKWFERLTRESHANEKAVKQQRLELFELQSQIFSTNTTTEQRIKLINELKAAYPQHLANINAETVSNEQLRGSLKKINDELINRIIIAREQDKIDEQNEKTADRYEEFLNAEIRLRKAVADMAQDMPEFKFDDSKSELQNAVALANQWVEVNGKSTSLIKQTTSGYFELKNALSEYNLSQNYYNASANKGNKLLEKRQELMNRLGLTDTNTSTTAPVVDPVTPGFTPTPTPTTDPNKKIDEAEKRARELLAIQRSAAEARLALIKNDLERELALEALAHQHKLEDLRAQLISEETIRKAQKAGNVNLVQSYLDQNIAINDEIESQEQIHVLKMATILENGINNRLSQKQAEFEKNERQYEIAYQNQLANHGDNEKARKKLEEQYQKERLERQLAHLEELKTEFARILEDSDFEGFDLEALSDDQVNQIKSRLQDLGLSIAQINALLAIMRGQENPDSIDLGTAGQMDVFGFTAQNWLDTFTNIETLEDKINAAAMGVQGFMNAWQMYHQFKSEAERKELQEFEVANNRKKQRLKSRLDNGLINQRQYDQAIAALEAEADKRKAEMEYKQAKRAWSMQLTNAIASTAMAVINGLNTTPFFPLGIAMGALAGILGGVQIGMIAKNKPVKGYESGLYDVVREQDGKSFKADYGGESRSGLVDKPTVFLAGEGGKNFPELIISGEDLKQFHPDLKDSLFRQIGAIKGFQGGYYSNQSGEAPSFSGGSTTDPMLIAVLTEFNTTMKDIQENGLTAFMSKELRNIQALQKSLDDYNKFKNKAKR